MMALPVVAPKHPLARTNVAAVARAEAALEGTAMCQEVGASVARLGVAITRRSWQAAFDEWSRLGELTAAYAAEFLRLAGDAEAAA